ncbi:hypothetical protein [Novosphingobium sp. JCM 18896]|uniref:hypothetical protein n=1 Tax=Novosphingobium sp. JCM 18896 TaxID=2989731 RepID=UPI002221DFF7|nr:hypothetical protein [Novosphingobium sp. JCM 18896]MCW1427507.1 hypothetical protein [Novosphingobium sp. JCM 18896]
MSVFSITPTNPDHAPFEVTSRDAAAVLHAIARADCGEADVLENGAYMFSVRLDPNGLWHIHQRVEPINVPISALG